MRSRLVGSIVLAALLVSCGDGPTEPVPERSSPVVPPVAFATTTTEDGLSISTDKDDYAPGDTVWFTGVGWQAEDTLDIVLVDEPLTHPPHEWWVKVDETGGFRDSTYVVDVGDVGVTFTLTATSRATGRSLTVVFTDGNFKYTTSPSNLVATIAFQRFSGTTCGAGTLQSSGSFSYNNNLNLVETSHYNISVPTLTGYTYDGYTFDKVTVSPASSPSSTNLCIVSGNQAGNIELRYLDNTTTELGHSPAATNVGQQVTFTATVKDHNGDPIGNKGSVTFYEFTGAQTCDALGGASPLAGPVNLTNSPSGQASFQTSALEAASHNITACYSGTSVYRKSFGSVTHVVSVPISPTTLNVQAATGTYGGQVNLSATLTSGGTGLIGRTIDFTLNGNAVGSATTVAGGVAILNNVYLSSDGTATGTLIGAATYSGGVGASYAGETGPPIYSASTGAANLTVDPRAITVKANDAGPIYYGDALPTFGYTLTGNFVGSDEAAFAATLNYTLSGAPNPDGFRNVGSYSITPGWTYNNSNYAISLASPGTGTLTIVPRPITVKANDAGPIYYGDALPTFGYTLTGNFVASDEAAFAATLSYALSGAPNSDGFQDAGTYTITPGWTYSNSNYAISLASPGTGTLTIDPRPITVKANDAGPIYYGDALPTFGYTLTGNFVGSDEAAFAATLSYSLSGAPNSDGFRNAGTYTITPSWTYANGNYALTPTTGTLTINPRPITIKANNAGPIYYADPLPTFSWTIVSGNFVASDQSAFDGVVTFQLSSSISPLPVGTHTITPVWSVSGGWTAEKEANYAITPQTGSITVQPWTLAGFYQPVDMPLQGGAYTIVWNSVKGGSTVPLKFEVFRGSTELKDLNVVQPLFTKEVACGVGLTDSIELTATGGTVLRFDTSGDQFIYNWQTPKKPGYCYQVTMKTADASTLVAFFRLK